MSCDTQAQELEAEIDRMTAELAHLNGETTEGLRCPSGLSSVAQPPPLRPFDNSIELPDHRARENKPPRKETEARRFSGEESVHDYLLQFELNMVNKIIFKEHHLAASIKIARKFIACFSV